MKLATCNLKKRKSVADQHVFVGVPVDNNLVVDLVSADAELARREMREACSFFNDMISFLEAGSRGRMAARRAVRNALTVSGGQADGSRVHRLSGVKLQAPVPVPKKLFCLSGNYQDHIEEDGTQMAVQDKETPRFFMKPASTCVIGQGDKILIPPVAQSVDWEGELAVVIGRKGKGIKRGEAVKYIAGYTIMNDVSERELNIWPRSGDRPEDIWFDWLNGKWLDTGAPIGPWIVTTDEIPNPQALEISTYVNGERKQHNSTGQMLVPVAELIEYISSFVTLEPGDIISTGTIAGVGLVSGTFLKPGDRVEVEISGIGVLKNRVAASHR